MKTKKLVLILSLLLGFMFIMGCDDSPPKLKAADVDEIINEMVAKIAKSETQEDTDKIKKQYFKMLPASNHSAATQAADKAEWDNSERLRLKNRTKTETLGRDSWGTF